MCSGTAARTDMKTEERIKQLLMDLHQELDRSNHIDQETAELVRSLDEDLHRLMDPDIETDTMDSIPGLTTSLEARFAAEHPIAEGLIRDIIETLGKMGI